VTAIADFFEYNWPYLTLAAIVGFGLFILPEIVHSWRRK